MAITNPNFLPHVAELALFVGASRFPLIHGVLVTTAAAQMKGFLQLRRTLRRFTFLANMTIAACFDFTLALMGMMTGTALHCIHTAYILQAGVQLVVECDIPGFSLKHNYVLIGRNLTANYRKGYWQQD